MTQYGDNWVKSTLSIKMLKQEKFNWFILYLNWECLMDHMKLNDLNHEQTEREKKRKKRKERKKHRYIISAETPMIGVTIHMCQI